MTKIEESVRDEAEGRVIHELTVMIYDAVRLVEGYSENKLAVDVYDHRMGAECLAKVDWLMV